MNTEACLDPCVYETGEQEGWLGSSILWYGQVDINNPLLYSPFEALQRSGTGGPMPLPGLCHWSAAVTSHFQESVIVRVRRNSQQLGGASRNCDPLSLSKHSHTHTHTFHTSLLDVGNPLPLRFLHTCTKTSLAADWLRRRGRDSFRHGSGQWEWSFW